MPTAASVPAHPAAHPVHPPTQAIVREVPVAESVNRFAVDLVRATRPGEYHLVTNGIVELVRGRPHRNELHAEVHLVRTFVANVFGMDPSFDTV